MDLYCIHMYMHNHVHVCLLLSYNYFTPSDPHPDTLFKHTVSDRSSGSIYGIYIYIYILTVYLTPFWHILLNITFYLAFYLASILTYFLAYIYFLAYVAFSLACVRVQVWPTASKACDMEFGFRRSPLHPELAIWRR